jgi:outer membrane protein OmpA-like peptidoglycan-associated protein
MIRLMVIVSLTFFLIGCDTLSGINTSQFESQPRGVADGVPLGARHLKNLQQYGVILADSQDGTHIILPSDRVFYQVADRVVINPDYFPVLNELVYILKGYPNMKLQVVGHSDGVMSSDLGDKQSSEFAYAITNYLTAAGISPMRITSVRGVGNSEPIDPRNNGTARALNRRVEIITQVPLT